MAETSEMVRELKILDREIDRMPGRLPIHMHTLAVTIGIRERLRDAGFDLDPMINEDLADLRISGRWACCRDEADMSRIFRQYRDTLPSPPAPNTPAGAFHAYVKAMRDLTHPTGPRIAPEPADTGEAHPDRTIEPPESSPAAAFQRHLVRVDQGSRATHWTRRRPLHPFYGGPAVGLSIVALCLVVYALARLMGWHPE